MSNVPSHHCVPVMSASVLVRVLVIVGVVSRPVSPTSSSSWRCCRWVSRYRQWRHFRKSVYA